MFLVSHVVALCVWIAACPQWLAPGGGGGGTASRPPAASPSTPGAAGGGHGGSLRRGSLPPAGASLTGSFPRQEVVYTPTTHEGAPGRGDGPSSLVLGVVEGVKPIVSGGPTLEWGGGSVAGDPAATPRLSPTPGVAGTGQGALLPSPPLGWECDRRPGGHVAPPDVGATGRGRQTVGFNPLPPPPPLRPAALVSLQHTLPTRAFFCSWRENPVANAAGSKADGE